MVSKVLCVLVLAAIVSSGYGLREVRLPDLDVNHVSHPYVGRAIGIAKNFWDTLRECHVIFPNGAMFEVFPTYRVTHPNVYFLNATQPFTSCGIGFRGVDVSFSGIYELLSTVLHTDDNSVSLTRQRFNIIVTMSDFN